MLAYASFSGSVGGWDLHHRGILVYGVDFVCESGGYGGSGGQRYICRDTAGGCAWLRRGTASRCGGGNVPGALAAAGAGSEIQPLKGRLIAGLSTSLKRCPDTNLIFLYEPEIGYGRSLQCSVPVHGEFGAFDHGGGDPESQGKACLHGL